MEPSRLPLTPTDNWAAELIPYEPVSAGAVCPVLAKELIGSIPDCCVTPRWTAGSDWAVPPTRSVRSGSVEHEYQ
jgi:hypothetical protein